MKKSYGNYAVVLSSLVIPSMFLVGQSVGQVYKHYNSAGVNINNGLAYLREQLLSSFSVGIIVLILALGAIYTTSKAGDKDKANLALKILGAQLAVFLILGLVRGTFPI